MIQPGSYRTTRHKEFKETLRRPCLPEKPRHLKNTGPGTAKSYFDHPGSGLLTRDEITRRRGGNPKGGY